MNGFGKYQLRTIGLCLVVCFIMIASVCSVIATTNGVKGNNVASAPKSHMFIPSPGTHPGPKPSVPPVDLTKNYASEPAPMGIADYGVIPATNKWYNYSTPEFLGDCNMIGLSVDNSTLPPDSRYLVSIQLNVVLYFNVGSASYYYWIQDVGAYDTNRLF